MTCFRTEWLEETCPTHCLSCLFISVFYFHWYFQSLSLYLHLVLQYGYLLDPPGVDLKDVESADNETKILEVLNCKIDWGLDCECKKVKFFRENQQLQACN